MTDLLFLPENEDFESVPGNQPEPETLAGPNYARFGFAALEPMGSNTLEAQAVGKS